MKQKIWWQAALCGVALTFGLTFAAHAAHPGWGGSAPGATPSTIGAGVMGLNYGPKTPESANANASQVARERLVKDAMCTTCHDESEPKAILSYYQGPHGSVGDARTPGCQTCHGSSEEHRTGKGNELGHRPPPDRVFGTSKTTSAHFQPLTPQEQTEVCLNCHKGGLRMRWPGSQHPSNDVTCTNCHTNHTPEDSVRVRETQAGTCYTCHKEKRAEFNKISHMPIETGKVTCSDCHNPHGSAGPKLLVKNTVNETCWECHADKRGPFLWEHQPATEDCTTCHNPHGSNVTPLLKSRPPFLCEECHSGPHNSVLAVGQGVTNGGLANLGVAGVQVNPNLNTPLASNMVAGRACLNCHVQIHGTNSPTGPFLHR
jgi:DmsE family decaheme c-type cytochrome